MTVFAYAPEILAAYPNITGGVILARGLLNGPTPEPLRAAFFEQQAHTIDAIGDMPLSDIPSVAAWRRVFSSFGAAPTKYRNAAEALLRRLTKRGDIPSINALVDLANLVSIRHRLPAAVFDQASVTGTTTVQFATGEECFTDLGTTDAVHPAPGEVVFVDEAGLVSARRWCWRQSAQSAASPATTVAVITVEGHHESADDDVAAALGHLLDLLAAFQPQATIESALLTVDRPSW